MTVLVTSYLKIPVMDECTSLGHTLMFQEKTRAAYSLLLYHAVYCTPLFFWGNKKGFPEGFTEIKKVSLSLQDSVFFLSFSKKPVVIDTGTSY